MVIKTPGTANLRADPHVYDGGQNESPAAKGEDAGGTANLKETTTVKSNPGKSTPTGSRNVKPDAVQTFAEDTV